MAPYGIDGLTGACHETGLDAVMGMAEEAMGCAHNDPEGAGRLSDIVVAWSLGQRRLLTSHDAWIVLCALPIQALAQAIDSPDSPYGQLLAHAGDALPHASRLHPHQHRLSAERIHRLETLGLGYSRMSPHILRGFWIRNGSATAWMALDAYQQTTLDHIALWWKEEGFVAPEQGFFPHLAPVALQALEQRLAMPRVLPHIADYLAAVLGATRSFDPRVLVPAFAADAPTHRPSPFQRDADTTAVLLDHPVVGACLPAWRDLFLAVSPDSVSAHHRLARKALLDRLPPLAAILSMPCIPETPEDLFVLRRALDAAQTG